MLLFRWSGRENIRIPRIFREVLNKESFALIEAMSCRTLNLGIGVLYQGVAIGEGGQGQRV